MSIESQNENVQAPNSKDKEAVVQPGSQVVIDRTGAFGNAEKAMAGVTETGRDDDFSKTLTGEKLVRKLNELASSGTTTVILDLSRAKELSEDDVRAIGDHSKRMKQKGITMKITGLTAPDAVRLRAESIEANGTKLFATTQTAEALKRTVTKDAEARQAA